MGAGGFKDMRDMIDGGGAGMSGPKFEGGAVSDIANRLGIKPLAGQQQPMGQPAPQAMPQPAPMSQPPMMPQRPQMRPASAAPMAPGAQSHPLPPSQQSAQYSPMMQYYQMLEMQRRQAGLL